MFDNVCKFLAETFSADFAAWFLGEPIPLTQLSPSELSLEPIRADALMLLESANVVLHLEFQTQPDPAIPFRMLDYRIRVFRRYPQKRMHQVVIYLRETNSDLVQQTAFVISNTRHEFNVIRLWEQPTSAFLQSPGLLPFAVLSGTGDRPEILRQVAQQIEDIPDVRLQNNVGASAAILAGLVLEAAVIEQILRREIMQESTFYQSLLAEGIERGKAEGKAEAMRQVALNLLMSGMTVEQIASVTGLTVEQVQQIQSDNNAAQN